MHDIHRGRSALVAAVALLLCTLSWAANAPAGGIDRLRAFLDSVNTLRAEFAQTLLDAEGNVVQEAQGRFALARPGRFRWDYQTPYEQLIVADGERVWIYDVELEQVTVKAQDAALSQTPAMLLSGTAAVQERFLVEDQGERGDLTWVELRPRQAESSFERILVAFRGPRLARMELVDAFDQVTAFRFSKVRPNVAVDPAAFRFTPPPGVDVVGEQ